MKKFILVITVAFFALIAYYLGSKKDIVSSSKLELYVKKFNISDNELYPQHITNVNAFKFLSENIPLIELPKKN